MTVRNTFLLALFILTGSWGCVVVPAGPGIGGPPVPVVMFETEPRLVLIPGMTIYYAPDVQEDIYVAGGLWYLRVNGVWYNSRSCNGPWVFVEHTNVPPGFAKIPPGHLKGPGRPGGPPPGQMKRGIGAGEGVPPGQLKKGGGGIPPGQLKKGGGGIPPGQLKKGGGDVPPGQLKKGGGDVPPGQLKKGEGAGNEDAPGQAKKEKGKGKGKGKGKQD